MHANSTAGEHRRPLRSMVHARWGLVALSALLAVVLVLSGAVVIGGIIAAMAIVRAGMLLRWQRERRAFRRPYAGARPGG
jgi:Na+-driven multidrug efflux pump